MKLQRRKVHGDTSVETYLADLQAVTSISRHKKKARGNIQVEQVLVGLLQRFANQT